MSYAQGTEVPVSRSRQAIEDLLRKAGATAFASGYGDGRAVIGCSLRGRQLRFTMLAPDATEKRFTHDGRGSRRTPAQVSSALEAEERRLWRALLLAIKSKLESVESRIETFDEAFLANVVLPGGRTVAEEAIPAVVESYRLGHVSGPLLQLGYGGSA